MTDSGAKQNHVSVNVTAACSKRWLVATTSILGLADSRSQRLTHPTYPGASTFPDSLMSLVMSDLDPLREMEKSRVLAFASGLSHPMGVPYETGGTGFVHRLLDVRLP